MKGYRLKLFDDKHFIGKKASLKFSLVGFHDIYTRHQVTLSAEMTEFAIYDWHDRIEELISVGNSLDAEVEISLSVPGQEVVRLRVRYYEIVLSILDLDKGLVGFDPAILRTIDVDKLGSVKVSVINLEQPEQNFNDLEPQSSQGVPTGAWEFKPETRQDGLWLIYPAKDSAVNFRPMLWPIGLGSRESEVHTLAKAMLISDTEDRDAVIKSVMREMANEPDHRSWDYLANLWKKTRHLPLSTFAIWRLSVSEPSFLASLFIRGEQGIVDRLEQELPVIWELVSVEDWQQVLTRYRMNIAGKLNDDDLAKELFIKKN